MAPNAQTFSDADRELIDQSTQQAEELAGDYFQLSGFGPRRYLYEVATAEEQQAEERATDAFAQICRYIRSPPTPGERRRAARYYRVCLQDARILDAVGRPEATFGLGTLLLYIMTHELIHIVRFEQFQHPFVTDPGDREREEQRVHRLTYDLLAGREDAGMARLLDFYRTHRMPRCL